LQAGVIRNLRTTVNKAGQLHVIWHNKDVSINGGSVLCHNAIWAGVEVLYVGTFRYVLSATTMQPGRSSTF